MFTGIIEEIGSIERVTFVPQGRLFRIKAQRILEKLLPEDSVSVNGICLTVTRVENSTFEVIAVEETIHRSTAGEWKTHMHVNLERALQLNSRLGGHLVLGHVDATGKVLTVIKKGIGRLVEIEIPEQYSKYVVEKGSIAVDGVSLTVALIRENRITISLVPHTLEKTTLGSLKSHMSVDVEVDFFGKYIERFFQSLPGQEYVKGQDWFQSMGY